MTFPPFSTWSRSSRAGSLHCISGWAEGSRLSCQALSDPTVTRDPILFLVGTFSVMLGVVLEVSSAGPSGRPAKLSSVASTLQTIGLAGFILAFVCAFYAHGFYDIPGTVNDFLVGRFSIIFPVMMILFSYLASARFNLGSIRTPTVLGIVAMLLSPASLYAIGRRNPTLGFVVALAFLLAGLGLFLMPRRRVAGQRRAAALINKPTAWRACL